MSRLNALNFVVSTNFYPFKIDLTQNVNVSSLCSLLNDTFLLFSNTVSLHWFSSPTLLKELRVNKFEKLIFLRAKRKLFDFTLSIFGRKLEEVISGLTMHTTRKYFFLGKLHGYEAHVLQKFIKSKVNPRDSLAMQH